MHLTGETLSREASLPALPVPSLSATLEKLKSALKPLLTELEYQELLVKITQFQKDPVSSALQSHLLKFHQNEDCYLDHLNLDHILIDHKALPRNPFLVLENDPNYSGKSQIERASVLTISTLKFVSSLRLGYLSFEDSRAGEPLTMKPYFNLFGTTRIPELNSIKSKTSNDSDHILILSNSQLYTLKVLNENNEIIVGNEDLSKILTEIVEETESIDNPNLNSIGPITSDSYRNWKSARSWLQQEFKENMNKIDSALFVLVLDRGNPDESSVEEIAKAISVGTLSIDDFGIQRGSCNSRWYDKLQLIVTKNAIAGVIWDSFSQDGTTVLRFTSDIYADSVLRLADGNYTLFPGAKIVKNTEHVKPVKIEWQFEADTHTFLHLSETRLTDLICSHSTNTKVLRYGRDFARKIGVKSDSLIQMSLQIAQYALYGKPISTVEPVSTRRFRNSRSELTSIQNDVITAACQIFVSDTSPILRWQKFIDICTLHSNSLKRASKGEGFEKHLKALQNVYLQREILNQLSPEFYIPEEVPPLIFDDVISPLFVPELIASNCGNPAMKLFGLTPATANGFGIGYIIKDDTTEFCLISQYRQGDRLLSTLEWVLHQLQHIWQHHVGVQRIPHAHALDNLKDPRSYYKETNDRLQSQTMSRSVTQSSSEDDVDLALGGYGYFDIEELTIRSTSASTTHTPALSSHNSTSELVKVPDLSQIGRKHNRAIANEMLKERFESHRHDDSDADLPGQINSLTDGFDANFDRAAVGKKVSVKEVLI